MTSRLFATAALVALMGGAVGLSACKPRDGADKQTTVRSTKAAYGTFGFDEAGMDKTVAPGDDFFRYANGGWVDRTEIPADKTSLGAFNTLADIARERTRAIIEEAAKDKAAAGDARKISDLYASLMDEAAIEKKGLDPIRPELAEIGAIRDKRGLSAALGKSLRHDVDGLNATNYYTNRVFGFWVAEDFAQPTKYAGYLFQGGLGMPDRDYYLSADAKPAELRKQYAAHIAKLLQMAGYPDAKARADKVMALETAIARAHWAAETTQDLTKTNNPWRRADFAEKAPGMDWDAWFEAAQLSDQPMLMVWQPSAISGTAALVGSQPLEVWKDYLAFHALNRSAAFLPKAWGEANFAFYGTALSGAKQQRDRWKRAVDWTNASLGEAVGKIYVQKHFSPSDKAKVEAIVKNLLTAFGRRIDRLAWMSPETKARAKAKLSTMTVGVGYPETWRDYSKLVIRRDDPLGNMQRAGQETYRHNLAKLHGPVDRNAWHLLPQDVNALNAPMQNSIIFPAAILAPTFFDPNADPAVNYGAIGGVIGHEITHGFDDVGALFDASGRISNWWTPADLKRFKAEGVKLARQYDQYEALPGLRLNGNLTLGENIADVAGLATAYDAYKLSLGGKPAPVLNGTTGEQRVFLGWAQNYRSKYRDELMRQLVLTDGHSPGPFRAQIVRNLDGWYTAFNVKPGQKLYLAPKDRVVVW